MSSFHDAYNLLQQADKQPSVLLETCVQDSLNTKSFLFHNPESVIKTNDLDKVISTLSLIDTAIKDGYYAAGYITYEAGFAFEQSLKSFHNKSCFEFPLIWFGIFSEPLIIHHDHASHGGPGLQSYQRKMIASQNFCNVSHFSFSVSKEDYMDDITRIKEYVNNGDTYQINYTLQVTLDLTGDVFELYKLLKHTQPVSYASYVHHDDCTVISLSPELFFRRKGGELVTKPMKGTVKRGRNVDEDKKNALWLRESEKNRAENIMIVDMLRNDLGRICKKGSIQVPELFSIEKYKTLFQMTSTITGELNPGTTYTDIFKSLFPCGSVTGAPKIRSMEIIHELEKLKRGIYTGAIGYISPHDEAVFNVAIRTVTFNRRKASIGIGSGIVWDSDADSEYDECELKLSFLRESPDSFSLIETMLYENSSFPYLKLHIKRLEESADYFDFIFDKNKIMRELQILSAEMEDNKAFKVRLLLDFDGTLHIEKSEILYQKEPAARKIGFSDRRTDSTDKFLFHKTTHRGIYSSMHEIACRNDLYDIIFMNERNEITEGCIHNIFVRRDGGLLTPPGTCGLLNGVKRQDILRNNPNAEECVITLEDVFSSEEVFLTNAVRGMQRVLATPVFVHEDGTVTSF